MTTLTDPQMTVLRALDALPEGEWATAKEGGFNSTATSSLMWRLRSSGISESAVEWDRNTPSRDALRYRLTPAGRALIAKLKAEGKW